MSTEREREENKNENDEKVYMVEYEQENQIKRSETVKGTKENEEDQGW